MPLLQINSSQEVIDPSLLDQLHLLGSQILSEELEKSIEYVMVIINCGVSLSFAQDIQSPCVYLEVKNVGILSPEKTQSLTKRLTALTSEKLKTKPNRTYIEFQESERHLWGWNGSTFA